jgi:hypothetical protein
MDEEIAHLRQRQRLHLHDVRAALDERIDPRANGRIVADGIVVERTERQHGPRADGSIEQRRADVEAVAFRAGVVRVVQHEARTATPGVGLEVPVEVREPDGGVHRSLVLSQETAPPAEQRRFRARLCRSERSLPREPAGETLLHRVADVVPRHQELAHRAAIAVPSPGGSW